MKYIVPTMALFSLVVFGCNGSGGDTNATTGALESCFATGGGQLRCVATPGGVTKGARDVDGDGKPDTFVCSNNEQGSHCDCAKLGCIDLRQRPEDPREHDGGACDGGRAAGEHDGGQTFDRGGGGRTGTDDRSGDGDMVCPPSATGSGGSGGAGTGAAGTSGSAGAGGSTTVG